MTITTIKQLLTFKVRVLLKGNWQQRHCYREVRERGGYGRWVVGCWKAGNVPSRLDLRELDQ